jgi:cyclophilin family peptidyl-prolyl cis-trans isomerase
MIRKTLSLAALLAVVACATPNDLPSPVPSPQVAVEESTDAALLRLEDRREYDRKVIMDWASDPRPERRRRAAIAIARIGSATFEDLDGDGWQGDNEPQAGTAVLLTLTADPDPNVRSAAAFALGETGDLRGAEALFGLAADEHPSVCSRAAEAVSKLVPRIPFSRYEALLSPETPIEARRVATRYLFRFATEQASGSAALSLDSHDTLLRREAAYTLSRHAIPQARRRVEALLREPDALTRAHAARSLGRIAVQASIDALLDAAAEPHAWVRTNAVRSLGEIIDRAGETLPTEDVAEIVSAAIERTSDPDTGTASAAIELLGRFGTSDASARSRLEQIAVSGSRWHRELAILWLVRSSGIESLDSIAWPDDPWVKVRIIEGSSSTPAGIAARARFFADANPSVRAAAIANIPTPPGAEDLRLVEAALADDDPVVRASAIGFVPEAFPERAVEILSAAERRARADTMNDARLAAIDALAKISAPEQESRLTPLLRDDDPVVRRVAADHLAALEGTRPQYTPLPIDEDLSYYEEIARWAARSHIASLVLARGELRIALRSDEAPMTAWNFARLASEGYFDGTTFMRVVPNFVIQGGDPRDDMSGGPGYAIRDEINMIEYARGTVGMALSGSDTGGSQFFVTHSPQPHLDGGYTVFGHAISGRGTIIEQIERGDRVISITVKEADWTQLEIDKVAGVPLPTVIGELTSESLLRIVPEYPERRAEYTPDPDITSYLATQVQPDDRILVILGTWCHDSQREVPRLLRILDELRALGTDIPVRFIAVDREKKEPSAMIEGLDVEMVSTIIYYRQESEIGRIVETPDGPLEDHLLRIVSTQ